MSLLIPGTNSIKDTGYNVANSLRFNDGSNDYLSISGSTPTNSKKFTYSFWVKRTTLNADQAMLSYETNSANRGGIELQTGDLFRYFERVSNSTTIFVELSGLFKDSSAWYNIIVATDTTQSTESDRVKIYVNGVLQTNFAGSVTYPSLNSDTRANGSTAKNIGRRNVNNDYYFDGYLAEVVFIDGSQLDQNSFGEFDEDSPTIWKPKDVSGLTFGNNGFHLDFENASSLGADVSGNSNNFTVNNLTSIDQSTDTCTNNFCTMNSLYPDGSITFSEGNLKLTQSSSSWRSAGGTIAVSTGKWYWETKTTGDYTFVGFADIQLFNEGCSVRESFTTGATTTATAFSLRNNDPVIHSVNTSGNQSVISSSTYSASAFTSATIGIALNLDDNEASWYINGTVQNSGTPLSISAGTYVPGISIYATNVELNFGSPPYSISSGNADANGFGNFEYSVPSGYFALCTKNLAEFG